MNRYFQLVAWFVGFIVCIGIPPLFIGYGIVIYVVVQGRRNQKKYEQHQRELRNRDIPPRGY